MYGMSDRVRQWFSLYLNNRKQQAKVNGNLSKKRRIRCGVPQGSILGPLLFIIYINDMTKYLNESKARLYADDTAIFMQSVSYIDLILGLKIEMEFIFEWLKANKLTLNLKTTTFMVFGSKHRLKGIENMDLKIMERQ